MTREEYLMDSFLDYKMYDKANISCKSIYFFGLTLPSVFLYFFMKNKGYNCIGFIDNNIEKVKSYNFYINKYKFKMINQNMGKAVCPNELRKEDIDDCEVFIVSRHYEIMKLQLMSELNMKESNIHRMADVEKYEELPIATYEELKKYLGIMLDGYVAYNTIDVCIQLTKENFVLKEDTKEELLFCNNAYSFWVNPLYFGIAKEIFIDKIYDIVNNFIDRKKKYTVLDMGGNRGYASLWFANQSWCKKVYTYEIIPKNIECILKNIHENPQFNIISEPYGLGNKCEKKKAYYFPFRDGISSIDSDFLEQYAPGQINNAEEVEVEVRKASDCLKLMDKSTFIIKIDVEGAEYDILEDISKNNPDFFSNVEIIIGDAHKGLGRLTNILAKHNFVLQEAFYINQAVAPFLYKRED